MIGDTNPHTHFERRIQDMRSERSSWIAHWKELAGNFSPRRGRFFESDRNRGAKRNHLINNTPLFAKRVLVAGLMTGVTSPARPWFRLAPPDAEMAKYGPVQAWLDEVERLMYRVFASSNFYKALPNLYDELCVFGTAAMIQEEDFEHVTKFMPFTAGEYMLATDGDQRVDSFAREFEMTVGQLVSRFGYDSVATRTRQLYDSGSYEVWLPVRHVIEPAGLKDLDLPPIADDMRWRSVYYERGERGDDRFLSVKGYRDFPILAPRWDLKAGDTYGYAPAMDALGDAKQLQVAEREKGKAIAKQTAPPMRAPTSLAQKHVSLAAGAVTFTDDPNETFRDLYQVQARVDHIVADIQMTEERINRAFYADLFLMIARQDDVRTATEIAARQEEKMLQLGPVLEGLQGELLRPVLDRTFNMLMRLSEPGWRGRGPAMLPPPPEELADQELKFEYVSTLAQAQKLVGTRAMERWIGFTTQLGAVKPGALDKINEDAVADRMAEDLGVSTDVVASEDAVAAIREQRAQQAAQAEQQQQMMAMVEAGKGLSQVDTTAGNAVGDLLGAA